MKRPYADSIFPFTRNVIPTSATIPIPPNRRISLRDNLRLFRNSIAMPTIVAHIAIRLCVNNIVEPMNIEANKQILFRPPLVFIYSWTAIGRHIASMPPNGPGL
ncbi:MAG: hypothetical protein MJZ31_06575 [Bacteroidales bacterium]|nr:hypothetical protein [Bacteroidales bacterium]